MYYLPEVKATDLVRQAFRTSHIANSSAGVVGGDSDGLSIGLDVAAACIRILERNMAKVCADVLAVHIDM